MPYPRAGQDMNDIHILWKKGRKKTHGTKWREQIEKGYMCLKGRKQMTYLPAGYVADT